MSAAETIRLVVPGDLRYRGIVVRSVAATCLLIGDPVEGKGGGNGLDLQRAFDAEVVSAVSEIFNNIAIHGYERKAHGTITIDMTPRADSLEIRIEDTGLAFDIGTVPAPELGKPLEGGMGIHIARNCVDELDYAPGPPNVWRLTKFKPSEEALNTPA